MATVYVTGCVVSCMHSNGQDQLLLRADSPRHAEYQGAVLRALLTDRCLSTEQELGGSPQ